MGQYQKFRMTSKMVLLLSIFIINVGTARASSNGWFGRANSEDWKTVNSLYFNVKADMKANGKASQHIGKAESDQLMVHNIQGLLKAQKYSIPEAANNFNVSENFLSKLMDTKPFNMNEKKSSGNNISMIDFKDQVQRFNDGNSSKNYAVFNISSFDCPDCNERTATTISNVKGTPTDSPMMEFTCQGLTVKKSGFYLLRPIVGGSFQVLVPTGNIELGCVSTVWLDKGASITFKIKKQDIVDLVGFQLRVHKV